MIDNAINDDKTIADGGEGTVGAGLIAPAGYVVWGLCAWSATVVVEMWGCGECCTIFPTSLSM